MSSREKRRSMSAGFMVLSDTDELTVPPTAAVSLAAFREWALSDEFPTSGRIDYVDGNIEVSDMAGEELDAHGTLKGEICSAIRARVQANSNRLRLTPTALAFSCPAASLSAEPDVVVVSYDAIKSGRVVESRRRPVNLFASSKSKVRPILLSRSSATAPFARIRFAFHDLTSKLASPSSGSPTDGNRT